MTRENADLLLNLAQRLRDTSRDYAGELLAENKRLIDLAAQLHSTNDKLKTELLDLARLEQENRSLRSAFEGLSLENRKLNAELAQLKAQAEREKQSVVARAWQVSEMSQKARELEARFSDADRSSDRLAKWFVALGHLHEAGSTEQIAKLIGEILGELIGMKRFGVFVLSRSRDSVRLAASEGVDASVVERLPAMNGRIAGACRGMAYVRIPGEEPAIDLEAELNTCFPLRAHGHTLGAVAIFASETAPALRGHELEALTLLVKHGGTALLTRHLLHVLSSRQTAAA